MSNKIKPIAFYLPQFHPIQENDNWWGKGFTEWTNVTKTQPRFEDHYQPHLPADLGFYDLRLEDARLAQEAMAKEFGIYGFCYYHYWFNGKRMLYEPLERKLKNTNEDFPFMLCWANENWTRTWDGADKEVLIEQHYDEEDDLQHIRYLCKNLFSDRRYIKIDGKPFFVVYRPIAFSNIEKTLESWRLIARNEFNLDLFIGFVRHFSFSNHESRKKFDVEIDFQPHFSRVPNRMVPSIKEKFINALKQTISPYFLNRVYDYELYTEIAIKKLKLRNDFFPGITPMWDNSARRKTDAFVLHDSTPEKYGKWLERIVEKYRDFDSDNKFIFINAWNEWAEGSHLEPCQKWGKAYLEKTKEIINKSY